MSLIKDLKKMNDMDSFSEEDLHLLEKQQGNIGVIVIITLIILFIFFAILGILFILTSFYYLFYGSLLMEWNTFIVFISLLLGIISVLLGIASITMTLDQNETNTILYLRDKFR